MAASLVPRIIVLALGAGALGFHDALRVLVQVAGRSPLTDIAICMFAMAVVTAQALGAILLARFVRKAVPARAGGDAHAPAPRTDRFAQVTLVVSVAVAFLVSACLLAASGAGARGLALIADVATEMKSPVFIAVLATATAAAVRPCARLLLRVFREEDRSQSPGAAGAGGRAAPAPAADRRRFGGKLTTRAPYLAVVSLALLCVVLTTYATLESGLDGAKYP